MFADHLLSPVALSLYHEIKFWSPIVAGAWAVFKAISHLKDGLTGIKLIRENDLTHLHAEVTGLKEAMEEGFKEQTQIISSGLKEQTSAVVNELRELRADIRSIR